MRITTARPILREFLITDGSDVLAYQRDPRYLLERLGMRPEGRLRENEYFKGRWWDTLLYGLLESEWEDSTTVH